jgi:hypothetical protein
MIIYSRFWRAKCDSPTSFFSLRFLLAILFLGLFILLQPNVGVTCLRFWYQELLNQIPSLP